MKHQACTYLPITQELPMPGLLTTLKQSASKYGCSEATLRDNAKARRLTAYQAYHGSPVMVMPSDLVEFLKSRPDIASIYHPKCNQEQVEGANPSLPTAARESDFFLLPEDGGVSSPIGDPGVHLRLSTLNHCSPGEVGLVANALIEVGRQLLEQLTTPPRPAQTTRP